jgi:4-hydroxy-tetrahydrodipicolinate synthase
MKKALFTGSCVAIVTPFTKTGVDLKKLEDLIEWHIKSGTDAILICGTTGEASTMPDEEHKSVIKFASDIIKKRVHLMAGTGSNDTKHAVDLTRYAESVGADSILSVTPYYNKTSNEGIFRHFKMIAESVSIPLIVYNIPGRTNLNMSPKLLKRISEIPNIVGVKECNLVQTPETVSLTGDDFLIYSGEDGLVIPMLSLGGKGVISVMANIIPSETSEMVHAWINGDHVKALEIQLRTIPLINALFCDVNPMPVKAAMNMMGMNVGDCRMPLIELSPENENCVRDALKNFGLI